MLCDAYVLYFYVLWLLRCAAAFSSSYVKWCFCYVMLRFVVVPGVLHWSFSLLLAYNFHIHPANGRQAQIAEEIYQYTPLMFRITGRNILQCSITWEEHLIKNNISYLGLNLSIHTCQQKPNPSGDPVSFKLLYFWCEIKYSIYVRVCYLLSTYTVKLG
jgi:hypothetical protein